MDDHDAIAGQIEALTRAALDRRLDRSAASPLVVAFSGGGDSLALLIGAFRWAEGAGRRLLAITVDHRLQADSARWAEWCADRALRLGVDHRTLAWDGEKPRTGLSAAARAVRHGLLAAAAREAGAKVILMGHTLDDRLEARLMRAAGGSVLEPREWSPSPIWPAGRGLFLLRPLLSARRATIRQRLTQAGETWLDDPANADPRHARVRARLALADGGDLELQIPEPVPTLDHVTITPAGEVIFGARASSPLWEKSGLEARAPIRALIAAALLCASGSDRPPRRDRLDRLLARLEAREPFIATLAGARVEAYADRVLISREAGDLARTRAASRTLPCGAPLVWDGRFEIEARVEGLSVAPLAGLARRLGRVESAALRDLRPAVRKALPAILDGEGRTSAPILAPDPRVGIQSLAAARFIAACGGVQSEADIEVHGGNRSDTLNRGAKCYEARK